MSISALIDEALATADTVRSTPFAAAAPEAACAMAERALDLLAIGDVDGAREAAENAAFIVDAIPHDEIAQGPACMVASAFSALGDETAANKVRRRLKVSSPDLPRPSVALHPSSAGLRRAFGD
jgi:hypothetical protein